MSKPDTQDVIEELRVAVFNILEYFTEDDIGEDPLNYYVDEEIETPTMVVRLSANIPKEDE